jgi:hypothetical protein
MKYQIALPPKLGVRPSDFVTTWNESDAHRQQAEAQLVSARGTYIDPAIIDGTIAVLTTVGGGIATNALYDLIKVALLKRGVHKQTHITQIKKPDGSEILIVDTDEP